MCALLTRMQIRHARTHSGHGVHRGREEGEGQTDRQSPRAVAVGLSRSTELRLPLPRAVTLIALRKDGAPTSVPPPPNPVAQSADRPIGPSAGADLTSARPPVCPQRSGGGACCVCSTYYITLLAHSLPFRVVCSIVVSQSLAFVVGLLPSLPPLTSFSPLPSLRLPRHRTLVPDSGGGTPVSNSDSPSQYSAMLLDYIRPESESWCQILPEGHQHASIKAFAVHRWKRDLVTLRGLRGSPFRPRPSLQYCIGDGHGLRQQYLRRQRERAD